MTESPKEQRPIYNIGLTAPENKYSLGRAIPTAYWISYFTLHWLTILGVVPRCVTTLSTTVYFLVGAILSSVVVSTFEATNGK